MLTMIIIYWPHILAVISLAFGLAAAIHAAMTKQDVRAAIGWVGVVILSPILGAVIYSIIGINRMRRRKAHFVRRQKGQIQPQCHDNVSPDLLRKKFGDRAVIMRHLGENVSFYPQCSGNKITMLKGGDETYAAMLHAIETAEYSIFLETYIFDYDKVGQKFVKALADAVQRGVAVRVLIDAVGARYSFPNIVHKLQHYGIVTGVFNGNIIIGLRLPYANLRTHRKILVIDGRHAFTGGMNIREEFSYSIKGNKAFHDTHFYIEGPIIQDLFHLAAEDWAFATGEKLNDKSWSLLMISPPLQKGSGRGIIARLVASGPDRDTMEANQRMLIGAFSIAKHHILIKTPYLLPDREFVSALVTAAQRGVHVDVIVPGHSNLRLVNRAMRAQFNQLLGGGCNIWQNFGPFDHTKLTSIDGYWSYVGSSNIDPRSLRLNFEVDIEIMDKNFTKKIESEILQSRKKSYEVTIETLKQRPFMSKLLDRIIWLGSPYL